MLLKKNFKLWVQCITALKKYSNSVLFKFEFVFPRERIEMLSSSKQIRCTVLTCIWILCGVLNRTLNRPCCAIFSHNIEAHYWSKPSTGQGAFTALTQLVTPVCDRLKVQLRTLLWNDWSGCYCLEAMYVLLR